MGKHSLRARYAKKYRYDFRYARNTKKSSNLQNYAKLSWKIRKMRSNPSQLQQLQQQQQLHQLQQQL